ncbi:hypothetical protein B0H14DRAFT_3774399 [Mycena olivaceomarginata]|nr:hypothetical protein B0H14DRAFT_3774399 [Mycena olivaceomarginata]
MPERPTATATALRSTPVKMFEILIAGLVLAVLICMLMIISKVDVDWPKTFEGFLPSNASASTKPCLDLLEAILERLMNHHEFPCADESRESFSAVVSRSVVSPVKTLTAQVEAQHRAIQGLAKTVKTLKNAPVLPPLP